MLCIRNGLLVLPGGVREADLYIRDDKIFSVGGRWAGADVIDASGCWVFPGFVGEKPLDASRASELSEQALTGGYTLLPVRASDVLRERLCLDTCTLSAPEAEISAAPEDTDREKTPAELLRELSEQGSVGVHTAMRILSEKPARLLGLYPRKGAIKVGSDADVTVWDPGYRYPVSDEKEALRLNFSSEEQRAPGRAHCVFLRGQLVSGRGMVLRYAQGRSIEPE